MKSARVILVAILLALQGCGGGDDSGSHTASNGSSDTSSDTSSDSGFYAPSYGDARGDTRYETNLSAVTSQVTTYQDAGKDLVSKIKVVDDPFIQVFSDYKVRLIEATKNSCPSGLEGCDTIDSDSLGVGHNALVTYIDSLTSTIRDQGERGTCVAFAMTAGTELLLSRKQDSTELAEQNTYFEAKRLTDTWASSGLDPYDTFAAFVGNRTKWVAETSWPYNVDDKYCVDYSVNYPDATCSPTEAQGGGSDTRQQDPTAAASSGYRLTTAHQLYASVGRIKQALYRGYPVAITVNANYDFQVATYKGGVVSWVIEADSCGTSLCGHEVLAVGYQDSDEVEGGGYLIIKNSWTKDWGDSGLAYVTYEWLQHSLLDAQALVRIDSAE